MPDLKRREFITLPLIAAAAAALRVKSCLIDGEAVACNGDGLPVFDRLRYRRDDGHVFLYAFDLIHLGGDDLRRESLEVRKATLASVLAKSGPGLRFNEHLEHDDADVVFRHACKMGLEGIVSKRKGSPYRSGRSADWLKMKNPACEAVKREAEEAGGENDGDQVIDLPLAELLLAAVLAAVIILALFVWLSR
jgi:bifunctional non-homologous end joining protein LigD